VAAERVPVAVGLHEHERDPTAVGGRERSCEWALLRCTRRRAADVAGIECRQHIGRTRPHRGCEERRIDDRRLAGAFPFVERGGDTEREVHRRGVITERRSHRDRLGRVARGQRLPDTPRAQNADAS